MTIAKRSVSSYFYNLDQFTDEMFWNLKLSLFQIFGPDTYGHIFIDIGGTIGVFC